MLTCHNITCKDYAKMFKLKKGQLNPNHSKAMSGNGNPRYGVIPSKETREKIRKIHKNKGTFKGEKNPMYGKTHTLEVRKKLSKFWKGRWVGNKNPFYGKKHTKRMKEYISKLRIEKGLAKGERNPMFGKNHKKSTKLKISQIVRDFYYNNPKAHPIYTMAKRYKKQKIKRGGYISRGQITIYNLIKNNFYKSAKLNYPIKGNKRVYYGDVVIPLKKLNVEYDGSYWHEDRKELDKIRDKDIINKGWKVIRIDEGEFTKIKPKEEILNYLRNLIK